MEGDSLTIRGAEAGVLGKGEGGKRTDVRERKDTAVSHV